MDERGPEFDKPRSRTVFLRILGAAIYGDAIAAIVAGIAFIAGQETSYGWSIFGILPIVSGFVTGACLCRHGGRKHHIFLASLIAVFVPDLALVFSYNEGAVCIGMAFPLVYLLHVFTALIGGIAAGRKGGWPLQVSFIVLAPFVYASESYLPQAPSYHAVTSTIIVNASPEKIWPLLINLNHISPTNNVLFEGGVAHPLSTHTNGGGVGAARFCELSTGEMPERIAVWQPGKLLVFNVLSTPASMKELNPFGPVHSGHLFGYFNCHQGRFELKQLGPNQTEIIGTSTYDHRFGPTWYWTLWCNYIVHSVHSSVLEEIKRQAERPTANMHTSRS